MPRFEVFIPAAETTGFNVTFRVDAENWMAALKTGMQKLGEQGSAVQNILVDIPVGLLSIANQIATLAFVRGAEFLSVFDEAQRHAIATFLLQVDRQGALVSEVFWGLWLLPLGVLVWRSGFLPRLLGGWLFANGLVYLVTSTTGLLAPQYRETLFTWATPIMFGEVALTLWLLIVGARLRPAVPPTAVPS